MAESRGTRAWISFAVNGSTRRVALGVFGAKSPLGGVVAHAERITANIMKRCPFIKIQFGNDIGWFRNCSIYLIIIVIASFNSAYVPRISAIADEPSAPQFDFRSVGQANKKRNILIDFGPPIRPEGIGS
jgi:hypothetical protein